MPSGIAHYLHIICRVNYDFKVTKTDKVNEHFELNRKSKAHDHTILFFFLF